jgi:hypothetical protein
MPKRLLATIIIIALAVTILSAIPISKANFYPFGVPTLEVHSPRSNPYLSVEPTTNILFDYYVSKDMEQVDHFSYRLDGNANFVLKSSLSDYTYNKVNYSDYLVSKTLENLANGHHSVAFYVQFLNGTVSNFWNLTIIIDSTYKNPVPLMISPLNQTTYNTKEVPITFTIDSNAVGDSLYSIDSNSNWTGLIGNGTLTNLSEGSHELKLIITIETKTNTPYVEYRESIFFNIDTNKTTSISSPTPTSTVPEFSWLIILPLFLSVLSIAVLIRKKKVSWINVNNL